MSIIISLLLTLSPLGPLIEPIKVHGSLTLNAEYAEKGHRLEQEAMLLSVSDFALLQSEVEFANEAWELRISDLVAQHKSSIVEIQNRFEQEISVYQEYLVKKDQIISEKSLDLVKTENDLKKFKWLFIGASAIATGALIYGFTEK